MSFFLLCLFSRRLWLIHRLPSLIVRSFFLFTFLPFVFKLLNLLFCEFFNSPRELRSPQVRFLSPLYVPSYVILTICSVSELSLVKLTNCSCVEHPRYSNPTISMFHSSNPYSSALYVLESLEFSEFTVINKSLSIFPLANFYCIRLFTFCSLLLHRRETHLF